MRLGIVYFTENAKRTAHVVMSGLSHEWNVFDRFAFNLKEWVKYAFREYDGIVFIGAAGIAVRLVAPHIMSKDKDPAVLVCDEAGRYVVPLLSGHIGGANKLAEEIAAAVGAQAVITTATDINNKFAVDLWALESGCMICDVGMVKHISAAVLKGDKIGFYSDFPVKGELPFDVADVDYYDGVADLAGICISLDSGLKPFTRTLNLVPAIVTLGIGCRRGTAVDKLLRFVEETLATGRISLESVKCIATLDLKKDEQGLLELADYLSVPLMTYTPGELKEVNGSVSASEFVRKTVGVDNVCERACLIHGGKLIVQKTIGEGMTLAASVEEWNPGFI